MSHSQVEKKAHNLITMNVNIEHSYSYYLKLWAIARVILLAKKIEFGAVLLARLW